MKGNQLGDTGGAPPAFLGKLFGLKSPEAAALEKLRKALNDAGKGTFRIYRTVIRSTLSLLDEALRQQCAAVAEGKQPLDVGIELRPGQ